MQRFWTLHLDDEPVLDDTGGPREWTDGAALHAYLLAVFEEDPHVTAIITKYWNDGQALQVYRPVTALTVHTSSFAS